MSRKAGGTDHLFLFTYENHLLWDMVFVLIFMIYLFIYLKWCKQMQRNSPPVFIYLCKWLVVRQGFRFNIHDLFVYLFKVMSTKAGGNDHLFLFTYANSLFLDFVFVVIFSIYLFIYSKQCQQKQVETDHLYYRPQRSWGKVKFLHPQLVAAAETCMVGKRAVRILLQCFLIYLSKLIVVIYF